MMQRRVLWPQHRHTCDLTKQSTSEDRKARTGEEQEYVGHQRQRESQSKGRIMATHSDLIHNSLTTQSEIIITGTMEYI